MAAVKRARRRVLSVDNSFTFGGAINALAVLVAALDDRYESMVLSAQDQQVLDDHFPGTAAHQWPFLLPWVHRPSRPASRRGGRVVRLASKLRTLEWIVRNDFPASIRIRRYARKHGIDLIHLNNGVEGLLPPLLAGKLLRIPVVAHSRGPQGTSGASRFYARGVDHWIAVSGAMADNLREAGVAPERITVVHDALDLHLFTPGEPARALRQELGIPPEAPVFGLFGRVIEWKGVKEFVEVATRVLAVMPDAYAVVVGDVSDGAESYFREVRALAAERGHGDRILFTRFRQDVPDLMRLCDVVAHTSIIPEPFGLTVIEAMATGTPVVAANAGGPLETVDPGETGLLADPRDPELFAAELLSLLRDPGRARAMGSLGAERARQRFSAERYAREVESVWDRVIGSS